MVVKPDMSLEDAIKQVKNKFYLTKKSHQMSMLYVSMLEIPEIHSLTFSYILLHNISCHFNAYYMGCSQGRPCLGFGLLSFFFFSSWYM